MILWSAIARINQGIKGLQEQHTIESNIKLIALHDIRNVQFWSENMNRQADRDMTKNALGKNSLHLERPSY